MSDLRTVYPWGPAGWSVTYAPDLADFDALERVNEAMETLLIGADRAAAERAAAPLFADLLLALVKGWSIRDTNGDPYPLRREALLALDIRTLTAIAWQITEDVSMQRPNAKTYQQLRAAVLGGEGTDE